ncbi:uncharacterized protein N7484_000767 [Penicillium longicatenatum]|uniref:uncharacterized protein n=1 Tax=Penicillium longicatenatum TaxID=1561947 RepID=UPI002549713E|nr:uncharacterized protein N7484_000767 [Penicillium longicatenatum]KAJ5657118.1 hypothetical protein N7484_000767 [Penicillium longicatenatum]
MELEAKEDDTQHIELPSGLDQADQNSPASWSWYRKHLILLQCGLHAVGPGFSAAILIPATEVLASQFNIAPQTATYPLAVQVLFLGMGPFLWTPLLNSYGRRPVLIGSMLLSSIAALGAGFTKTYGTHLTARLFQAIGISSGFIIPGVIVVDLFRPEQRGSKNGRAGWEWAMWLVAIVNFAQVIFYVFTCPETSVEHRRLNGLGAFHPREYLILPKRLPGRLRVRSFLEPLLFIQSPPAFLIVVAYGITFGIISPGMTAIIPLALKEVYNFGAIQQGLFFLGSLVGVALGERLAGPGSDWTMNRERRLAAKTGRSARLESRLYVGVPGLVFSVVGVLIFGFTLKHRTHWIGPCLGHGIASFGLQLVTTPFKTYCVDSYTAHSGSVLQFINVVRQVIAFTVPFWSPNLNEALGYDLGFGVEAIILVAFYAPSLLLFWKGAVWRQSVNIRMLKTD